jgi:hypothetical protein
MKTVFQSLRETDADALFSLALMAELATGCRFVLAMAVDTTLHCRNIPELCYDIHFGNLTVAIIAL